MRGWVGGIRSSFLWLLPQGNEAGQVDRSWTGRWQRAWVLSSCMSSCMTWTHRHRGPVIENEQALKSRGSPDLPSLPQHFQRPHPETRHLHQPREAWLPVCWGGVGGEWPWACPCGAPVGCRVRLWPHRDGACAFPHSALSTLTGWWFLLTPKGKASQRGWHLSLSTALLQLWEPLVLSLGCSNNNQNWHSLSVNWIGHCSKPFKMYENSEN